MPERESKPTRVSSFFEDISNSAKRDALDLRKLRKSLFNWAHQGRNDPERIARMMIVFMPALTLSMTEGSIIFIKSSSKSIANITKNKL